MFKLLKIILIFVLLKTCEAQMTQNKFKKHFVVKSTWAPAPWPNNAQRYAP